MNSYTVGDGGTDKVTFPDGRSELFTSPSRLDSEDVLVIERIETTALLPPAPDPRLAVLDALASSDAGMARLIEDIAHCLLAGDASLRSLPAAAQAKLAQRAAWRRQLSQA